MKRGKYMACDIETTGLDPRRDRLIEIACVAVDDKLEQIGTFEATIDVPHRFLSGCGALEMHLRSGLIVQRPDDHTYGVLNAQGYALSYIECLLCSFVKENFEDKPVPIGHSFKFDRDFLQHWTPSFYSMLHYRTVDARSFEEMAADVQWPEPAEHRALSDARRSLRVAQQAKNLMLLGWWGGPGHGQEGR